MRSIQTDSKVVNPATPSPYVLTAVRNEYGLWRDLPFLESFGTRRMWSWPEFDLDVEYAVCTSKSEKDTNIRGVMLREYAMVLRDTSTGSIQGTAAMDLMQCCSGSKAVLHYIREVEPISDDWSDFIDALMQLFSSSVFKEGQWIANFRRLELAQGSRLKGKGAAIGLRLMREMQQRHRVAMFLLEPFPLQYRTVSVNGFALPEGERRDGLGFAQAKAKLVDLYRAMWNARSIGDKYMFWSEQNQLVRAAGGRYRLVPLKPRHKGEQLPRNDVQ